MKTVIVTIAIAGVLAAGCSQEPATETATPVSAETDKHEPVAVKPGDTFTDWNPYGQGARALVTLHAVELDPPVWRASDVTVPHFLGVEVTIDLSTSPGPGIVADSFDIREAQPGGMVATSEADKYVTAGFSDGRSEIVEVKRGTKQRGWLLLTVQQPSGVLVWDTSGIPATITYP